MPREKDFAWAYCEKIPGSIKLLCKFCKDQCSGGILRFKYHLACIPGHDIGPCRSVPIDVKHQASLAIDCMNEVKSKRARINAEISSAPGAQTSSNTPFSPSTNESSMPSCQSHIPTPSHLVPPIPTNLNTGGGNIHSFFAPRTQPNAQPSLDGTGWKKNVHIQARKAITTFWYYCDLPFNYARRLIGRP